MEIRFATWVTKNTLRWHLRFFRYQFIDCLRRASKIKGADVQVRIAAIGLDAEVMDHMEEQWKDCPIPVHVSPVPCDSDKRWDLIFRPRHRIAGLLHIDRPDYIISLHPGTEFKKDSVHDYLDTCVKMERRPELGCVIHSKLGSPAKYGRMVDKNAIHEETEWGHRQRENVVFRNLSNFHPDYDCFLHKSIDPASPYYLEDITAIYSGMFEGWGIGVRYHHQASVWDPTHKPGQIDYMTNCFNRSRGDSFESNLNNGWRRADRVFFSQIIYPEDWERSWKYIQKLQMRPQFFEQFKEKQILLKNTVA